MNRSIKRIRYTPRRKAGNIGDSPGAIVIPEDAVKPLLSVYSYNAKELVTSEVKNIKVALGQFKKCQDHTHWIQVRGLGDAALIEEIGSILKINPLVLEDITNIHQRPKFDEYDNYIFAVSRMISFSKDYELINNQFSALVKDNIIITFEETHNDYFEAVKNRLAAGKGAIRTAGAGYMCYALTDTILDRYFALLAQLGDQLDLIEDRLYASADKTIMYETQ
jgi:magnesium transporter